MIRNLKEKDLQTKQEGSTSDDHKAPVSLRPWSGLKNPRIVRVSRAFGGKDRHSKVSTIRGLRDRRVRLSVPTAIQLYDLQDRLGLNQPSKVVDWLLDAAQYEIDKLPPLQLPPGNFIQFSQSLPISYEATRPQAPSRPPNIENFDIEGLATSPRSTYWNSVAPQRTTQREDPKELRLEKGNIIKGNEVENAQVSSHGPLPKPDHSLVSGLLSNTIPYTSYYHWEASNAYLSQLGIHPSQVEAPSSRPQAPESQIVLCPPGVIPSMFPSYVATPTDFDAKQFSHLQMASSVSQNLPSNSTKYSLHLGGPSARPFQ